MDLLSRWADAWAALGAAGEPALLQELLVAYREPHRHYHTLQHLEECFNNFDLLGTGADHPAEIELALWFHDAIYDTRRHDNEQRSAQWAHGVVCAASLEAASRVHALVMATRHHAQPLGIDAQILVDVDVCILGAPQERFDEYERQVRQEYAWVPLPLYRRERRRVLTAFLARRSVFNTGPFVQHYETPARANLERAVARL